MSQGIGGVIRAKRKQAGLSQAELGRRTGVSERHLSFIENGRAKPSREMVSWLGTALGLAESEIGALVELAGYAVQLPSLDLSTEAHAALRADLASVVDALTVPAVVHDRFGTLLVHNAAFEALIAPLCERPVFRGFAGGHRLLQHVRDHIENWPEIAAVVSARLLHELAQDSCLDELARSELSSLWRETTAAAAPAPGLLHTIRLRAPQGVVHLSYLTCTVGTPKRTELRSLRLTLLLPRAG